MKKESLDEYRSNITLHLTRVSGDIEHIKENVESINKHLNLINGRLRTAENSLSAHKAVGITIATVLTIAVSIVGVLA